MSRVTILYSLLVIFLTGLICYWSFATGIDELAILSVLTPTLVAVGFTWYMEGTSGLREILISQTIRPIPIGWLLLSLFLIPLLALTAMWIYGGFDPGAIRMRTTQLMPQIVVIVLIAFGEEYGWRGFLLKKLLTRFSVFQAGLISGLIWGLWHYPAYLIGTGTPADMPFAVFLVWVLACALFIAFVYARTQSVLTSILIHISANVAFNYLLILPEFTGNRDTFYLFTGLVLVVVLGVFAGTKLSVLKGEARVQV